jgi:proline iminopeptidase
MRIKNLFLSLTLVLVLIPAGAHANGLLDRLLISLVTRHERGSRFCTRAPGARFELGKRVQVPVDYNNPKKGLTSVYSWTYEPFNPMKPTILFFEGGPGGSSRGKDFNLPNFNIIHLDQRGIACSQAETKKQHKDHNYYSSISTARDADEIRKAYKIDKLTVYGSSYGTVPATIYGSLFAANTRAVILEGVVFQSNTEHWRDEATLRIAQKIYNNLSQLDKDTIGQMNRQDPHAFSDLINQLMYLDDAEENLKKLLDMYRSEAQHKKSNKPDDEGSNMYLSVQAFRMINCKEFGMLTAPGRDIIVLPTGKLVYDNSKQRSPARFCKGTGIKQRIAEIFNYDATNFPLYVPTIYFQGARDGATPGGDAVRHYKQVAKSQKQIFIMPNGGHGPNFYRIAASIDFVSGERKDYFATPLRMPEARAQRAIFSKAAMGEMIGQELIDEFNRVSKNPWVYSNRRSDETQWH